MYNLIVTATDGAWDQPQYECERSRFLEYTAEAIRERYGKLTDEVLSQLKSFPTLFAYEGRESPVRFGYLIAIKERAGCIQIEPRFDSSFGSRPFSDLAPIFGKLDIGKLEIHRTHWAIKDENLVSILTDARLLARQDGQQGHTGSGLDSTRFRVGLSFPGERRPYVQRVASQLTSILGMGSVFYDKDYTAHLARPNLDTLLQRVYQQSDLVVVFLCKEYESKEWCGLEWRSVRQIIKSRNDHAVMFMRFDDTQIPGVLSVDGYVDLNSCTPEQAALYIVQRVNSAPFLPRG